VLPPARREAEAHSLTRAVGTPWCHDLTENPSRASKASISKRCANYSQASAAHSDDRQHNVQQLNTF